MRKRKEFVSRIAASKITNACDKGLEGLGASSYRKNR
jgi:hypothetical protein